MADHPPGWLDWRDVDDVLAKEGVPVMMTMWDRHLILKRYGYDSPAGNRPRDKAAFRDEVAQELCRRINFNHKRTE